MINESEEAFLSGRYDALTTDTLQLAGFRSSLEPKAAGLTIPPEQLVTGPSGSMVHKGDDRWVEFVPDEHYAQVEAESLGVTQANVDSFGNSADQDIRRLGREAGLGKSLGFDDLWAYNVIRQIGNYAELYDRSIAPEALS